MASQMKLKVAFYAMCLGVIAMTMGMYSPDLTGTDWVGPEASQNRTMAGIFAAGCMQFKTKVAEEETTLPITCSALYNEQAGIMHLLKELPSSATDRQKLVAERQMIAVLAGLGAVALALISLMLFPSAFGKYGVTRCGTKILPICILLTVAAGAVSLGMFCDPYMITKDETAGAPEYKPSIPLFVIAAGLALQLIAFLLVLMAICAERRRVRELQRVHEEPPAREPVKQEPPKRDYRNDRDYRGDYNSRSHDHHNAHLRYDH